MIKLEAVFITSFIVGLMRIPVSIAKGRIIGEVVEGTSIDFAFSTDPDVHLVTSKFYKLFGYHS